MRKLLITALSLMLVLVFSLTTFTVFASDVFDIVEVEEAELEEFAEEEVEIFADASTAVCYIGEDEASRVYYATLEDAVAAVNAKWIYLMKDVTWEGATHTGKDIRIKSADSTRHKITMTKSLRITGSGNLSFENIIIDLNYKGTLLVNGSVATLTNTDVLNGTGDWGTIMIGDWGAWGIVTVNGNSTITGKATYANAGGVVTIHDSAGGKFVMNGGTIVNMAAGSKPAVKAIAANGTVEISGNTTITNGTSTDASPTTGTNKSIMVKSATALTVKSNFTGSIAVTYGTYGETFGIAESGLTLTETSIVNGSTNTPATIVDGKLVWDYNCYIGTDEPANRRYNLDKVVVPNNRTNANIYLVKDAKWKMDSASLYSGGIPNAYVTIYGNGYKITTDGKIREQLGCVWIFDNVTVDFGGTNFEIMSTSEATLRNGAKFINGGGHVGGTVAIMDSAVFTVNSGCYIDGKTVANTGGEAKVGSVIHIHATGTLNFLGGEIANKGTTHPAISCWEETKGTIKVSGDAKITGDKNYIRCGASSLVLTGNLTNDVKISCGSTAGAKFGTAESGATGADKLVNASNGNLFGAIQEDGSLVWSMGGDCYIGTNTASRMSLHEAVSTAAPGSVIYVTKDTTWDNVGNYRDKHLTITSVGGKKKVTMPATAALRFTGGNITFNNITIDFNFNGYNLQVEEGATVSLVGADVINGKGSVGGTVIIGSTSNGGHFVMDENSTVSGKASNGGAVGAVVHLHGTGISKFTFNGGTIINYDANSSHFAVATWTDEKCNIIIGGNAKIVNGTSTDATPTTGVSDAIKVNSADRITLKGDFTGDIKINYGSLGDKFGTAEAGATITGNLTYFSKGTPAVIKNGDLIWDYACYVGTDTAENRKYSLNEALRGTTAKTVYLVRDAEWVPHEDSNVHAIANLKATVNGNGYTLTPSKQLLINVNVDLTFENVTVDLNGNKFYYQSASKLTLNDGAHIINGNNSGGQGGAISIISGRAVVITMNEGSSIKNSSASYGGAIVLVSGSSLIMNGGEISGNRATVGRFGGGVYTNPGSKVIISGNAKIEGNRSGPNWDTAMTDNLCLTSEDILTVNSGFTGHIGINYEANSSEGKAVAKAGSGLTSLPSVKSITNDRNAYHFGWINSEGNIIWQLTPEIAPTLQYGTYAEGTKGIIRFTNTFASAPANAKVTSFGTYILDNTSFSEEDLEATDNKFVKSETSVLASGKGFITDLHTGNLEKSYTASSFCYIEGIAAPVFTTISADAINSADGVIELSDEAVAGYESLYEN